MRLTVSSKSVFYSLVCIYSFANILVCYIFKGENMNTFSVIYCGMLIGILLIYDKCVCKQFFYYAIWGVLTVALSIKRESEIIYISSALMFVVTTFCFLFFSEKYVNIEEFGKYIICEKHVCYVIQTAYFLILLIHYMQYGLKAGWNTWVLQGPYNYPHTLSYLLLFFALMDIFLWIRAKSGIGLCFAGISVALALLTAVRVALLSAVIMVLFILWRFMVGENIRKLLFCLVVGGVGIAIAYKVGLLEALIEKTRLAVARGNISNGRGNIIKTSLKALTMDKSKGVFNSVFGIGMKQLLASNKENMEAAIHAHNDLIDVFVCYGVGNLFFYMHSLYKFVRKYRVWFLLCIGMLVLGNGLFMYIDAVPMLLFIRLFFERTFAVDGDSCKEVSNKRR